MHKHAKGYFWAKAQKAKRERKEKIKEIMEGAGLIALLLAGLIIGGFAS